jgi:hypothetical protein
MIRRPPFHHTVPALTMIGPGLAEDILRLRNISMMLGYGDRRSKFNSLAEPPLYWTAGNVFDLVED